MRIEFFIALRHITERKFQSIFSILGVSIGVTVFIVSLTVSNGLEKNMIDSLLTLTPHITIKSDYGNVIEDYETKSAELKKIDGVTAVIPKYSNQAIVKYKEMAKGVIANGIKAESASKDLKLKIIKGKNDISELNSILVGEEFSKEMGVDVGDEINIVSAENKEIKLIIRGIFKTGYYEYDSNLVILPLTTMQILSEKGEAVTEMGINVKNPQKLENQLKSVNEKAAIFGNNNLGIYSWSELNQNLLSAVKFEKFVLVSILSLLIMIACFAVSVILNMIVREKTKDIGILKSIGYSNKNIRRIFTIEGLVIGLSGMILASIMSPLVLLLLKKMFKIFMKTTYYLEELPLYISMKEIVLIYIVTTVIVFLSTLYPAIKASRLKPVEALKHE
ncbi:MAG: ABC transporter permease [Leptotrichiaceae bacterium]|nr:ABC transporter permease [Leptotrichiaceae bacterium]MBP9538237.1 ABC transporter permease [Leptotrichiaceae bacterium]